jgi:hypothetical protein
MKNHVYALSIAWGMAGAFVSGGVDRVDASPIATELTLENGWTHAPYDTRNAAATVVSGIVHLSGAIANGTYPVAFTLPADMRPGTNVFLPVDLCHATKGRLLIQPSGAVSVEAEGGAFGNARCFTSLEGVSFAPSADGFTDLALENGWTQAPYGTSRAAASKIDGTVHLKGAIAWGMGSIIATLPSDLRPAGVVYVPVDLCNAAKGRLVVQPNGALVVQAQGAFSDAQCFTSLDGVSFAQGAAALTGLSLENGWSHAPYGTRSAALRDLGGVVQLAGAIAGGTSAVAFTLPATVRPPKNVYVPVDLCQATKGRLLIQPSGVVSIEAERAAFSNAQCFTSLDGVTFALEDDLGQSQQPLTGAQVSTRPSWVVELTADGVGCSASVLSEHVLLTAAHCLDGVAGSVTVKRASGPGTTQTVYIGPARYLTHPNYEAGVPLDPEDDIALVRLRGGAVNLSLTGRAKLYADSDPPWTRPDPQQMSLAGWGLVGPAGSLFCTSNNSVLMLADAGNVLRPAGAGQKDMTAPLGPVHICPGDSGSPWLFSRAGDFAAFAVTSGVLFDFAGPGLVNKATTILPKMAWIYNATVADGSGCNQVECFEDYLLCRPVGTLGDLGYNECFEGRRVTGTPPDPSSACPVGQHCCEPGTDRCLRCVGQQQQCP